MPIRVDFYLLTTTQPQSEQLVACRLLEKAYLRGHQVFVQCEHRDNALSLDNLLWTFKEDSFIPHSMQEEQLDSTPTIQIGCRTETPPNSKDILFNMAASIPPYFLQFQRIIEIVSANDEAKQISRRHYREYKNNHCEIHTHSI